VLFEVLFAVKIHIEVMTSSNVRLSTGEQVDVCSFNVISTFNDDRIISRNEFQVGYNIKLNLRDIV
jgi:hypothetical protein